MSATPSTLRLRLHLSRAAFSLSMDETLPAGGIIALFGPSGAGKTTVLRCVAGLERAAQGLVSVNEAVWQDEARGLFMPPHARSVGMVFQEPRLFEHLNARGNLEYGLRRTPAAERRLAYDEVVDTLDLSPLLERAPDRLSGGERQRVALGRALLTSPRLLLLDEPLAALDRARKTVMLDFLARLPARCGMTILLVSHLLDEVIQVADHLLLLEHGRTSGHGPLAAMLQRLDLSLARRDDAGAVIVAVVEAHDEHFHLTTLSFAGQRLTIGQLGRGMGTSVRLLIHARDVSLTLDAPRATTILNVLPCRITAIAAADHPAQALVSLEIAGQPLLARVTRKSCEQLRLRPGMAVYAQIKSVALAT